MGAVYRAAARLLTTRPGLAALLDGRAFLRAYQVNDLLALGAAVGRPRG
jgi:hypothetical protein